MRAAPFARLDIPATILAILTIAVAVLAIAQGGTAA